MAEPRPKIIPPRVPFVDPRTGTIAREWFRWLLAVVGKSEDADILSAFEATTAIARFSAVAHEARDTALLAQFPQAPPPDRMADIQDARLLSAIESQAQVAELAKQVADLAVLVASLKRGLKMLSAAQAGARVSLHI